MRVTIIAGVCAAGLAACSDSDDSAPPAPPPPPPPPANAAPQFTSPASAGAPENEAGAFYQATATDADGDALTFSISGGADAAFFQIAADGALSFMEPANFERPLDADRDNAYEVAIRASDGADTAEQTVSITVEDGPEAYGLTRIATGLAAPLFLIGRPGEADVFVTEREGVVRLLDPATGAVAATPFLDIAVEVGTAGEGGLIGFAPAPDYAASGVFYVHITNNFGDTEIRRYVRDAVDPDRADAASADIVFTAAQPAGNHNGGWIGFGADGFLYIALGDGGGAGDPFDNGQDADTVLGALLRIDPLADDFPGDPARDYAIPAGNPFASGGGAPEIFAFGLRNPFRSSVDRDTGDIYLGDVGQGAIEEIDLVPAGVAGLNFGWPAREGTAMFAGPDSPDFTAPVAEYPHGPGPRAGDSTTGGYVYRGPIAAIEGQYFFADFITDNVWSVPAEEFLQGETIPAEDFAIETNVLAPDAGALDGIVSFGEDNDGNLFILTIGGDIFQIVPVS